MRFPLLRTRNAWSLCVVVHGALAYPAAVSAAESAVVTLVVSGTGSYASNPSVMKNFTSTIDYYYNFRLTANPGKFDYTGNAQRYHKISYSITGGTSATSTYPSREPFSFTTCDPNATFKQFKLSATIFSNLAVIGVTIPVVSGQFPPLDPPQCGYFPRSGGTFTCTIPTGDTFTGTITSITCSQTVVAASLPPLEICDVSLAYDSGQVVVGPMPVAGVVPRRRGLLARVFHHRSLCR